MRNRQNTARDEGSVRGGVPVPSGSISISQDPICHPLTSRTLDILGRSAMGDSLSWYSEPIYRSRKTDIEDLIAGLERLETSTNVTAVGRDCQQLKAMLERAVTSAGKLSEALDAAESEIEDQEDELQNEREHIQAEIRNLHCQIETADTELRDTVKEALDIASKAGLCCNEVTRQGLEKSIEEAAPKAQELAGALGVPLHAPKTSWEQILSLPTEVAPWAVGPVVGIALGLIIGILQLRMLREFTSIPLIMAVFLLGVVITGTMAEGLAALVHVWVPGIIRRHPNLPAQLELSRRLLIGWLIFGCVFVLCEVTLEALGFVHVHNLIAINQLRMIGGALQVEAQTELMHVATPVYLCLGFVVSAPLVMLKVGRAIQGVQNGLVNDHISERIRRWKQDKRVEVARAVVLSEDCDMLRCKITDLVARKMAHEEKLISLIPSISASQLARITVLEEQARGKAGKFWQLFESTGPATRADSLLGANHSPGTISS